MNGFPSPKKDRQEVGDAGCVSPRALPAGDSHAGPGAHRGGSRCRNVRGPNRTDHDDALVLVAKAAALLGYDDERLAPAAFAPRLNVMNIPRGLGRGGRGGC